MLEPFPDSQPEPLVVAGGARLSPTTLTLAFRPPYDWDALIGFLGPRAIPGVEAVRSGVYSRTIAINGAHGWISIRPAEPPAALLATIHFPLAEALPLIAGRIRHLFDLDADPALIAAHLSTDPVMADLVAARPGMRVPGAWDPFELAVRAIFGQQITVARATGLAGKLVALAGMRLPGPPDRSLDDLTHLFPTPSAILRIDDLGLALGIPRARAAFLTALAKAALADPDLFAATGNLDQSVAALCTIKGIGEWTAQYIAMRALHLPDAFPHSDIGLIRALQTGDRRPTPKEVLTRGEAWRPWRAYATLHLWLSESSGPRRTTRRKNDGGRKRDGRRSRVAR
ncbi:MAG: DNA-3-methyladenine glycosylase family protein [Acetobacteraceae bacterium]